MDIMGSLLRLAARQHNVVHRRQAVDDGWSEATFTRTMRRQGWTQLLTSVWLAPGHTPTMMTWAVAASLACGEDALLTGEFGLGLHGALDLRGVQPRIVVPMSSHVARHITDTTPVKVIASRTVRPNDRTSVDGLPVARPERCFIDAVIPPTPPIDHIRHQLITAVQRRATSPASVAKRAGDAVGVPGLQVLQRAVLDVASVGADSPLADQVHRRLLRDGFSPDPHPVPVRCPHRTLHPDITFAGKQVCLECDGLRFHSEQQDVAIDDRKDRSYKAAKWNCFRIGWWEFNHGWEEFTRDLAEALHAAPS
jgi:hypothetical protein